MGELADILFSRANSEIQRRDIVEGHKLIQNMPIGKESKKFNVGDTVTWNTTSHKVAYKVIECDKQNGFFWYTIEDSRKKQTFQHRARQIDLEKTS